MPTHDNASCRAPLKDKVLLALDSILFIGDNGGTENVSLSRGDAIIIRTLPERALYTDALVRIDIYRKWSVSESNGEYVGTSAVSLHDIENLMNGSPKSLSYVEDDGQDVGCDESRCRRESGNGSPLVKFASEYEETTHGRCEMNCCGDQCGDNRFEVIGKAKKHLLEATNIEMSPDEMKVIDSVLFRCWQMGWLKEYDDSENEPKPFVKKTFPRTKQEAIEEVRGWTCPVCGKKGKDLSLNFKYNVVEVTCCGEDGKEHGSFWAEYDPNLEENQRLMATELIRQKHDLDHCLANMARECLPGTSVDDLWNEFVDKVKPPEWYTRSLQGDVDDLVRKEVCGG